jgi:hypothetical protein
MSTKILLVRWHVRMLKRLRRRVGHQSVPQGMLMLIYQTETDHSVGTFCWAHQTFKALTVQCTPSG